MRFKVLSLLDITKTGAHKNKVQDNDKSVAQFANYMTFENCLQLRTNINIITPPKVEKMEIGQQYVYEYVKNTYLTFEEYAKLFKYAKDQNLDVLVSCWDIESLYFAKEVGIKTIKIIGMYI